jgi:hypothetical protein
MEYLERANEQGHTTLLDRLDGTRLVQDYLLFCLGLTRVDFNSFDGIEIRGDELRVRERFLISRYDGSPLDLSRNTFHIESHVDPVTHDIFHYFSIPTEHALPIQAIRHGDWKPAKLWAETK